MSAEAGPPGRRLRVAIVQDDEARRTSSASFDRDGTIARAVEAGGHELIVVPVGRGSCGRATPPSRRMAHRRRPVGWARVGQVAVLRSSELVAVHLGLDHGCELSLVDTLQQLEPDVVMASASRPALPLLLGRELPVVLVMGDQRRSEHAVGVAGRRPWPTRVRPPRVIATVTDEDRGWATRCWPRSTVLTVPHGIDVEHWAAPVDPEPGWSAPLFTVGDYRDRHNLEQLLAVTDEIERRGLGRSLTIGVASAAPLITPAVPALHPLGPVADPRRGYAAARIALVPLTGGPEASAQILRAWASGCPVVTTTAAAREVQGRDGRDLAAAPDASGIVDRIQRLMADPDRARRVAERGRGAVRARHSLDATAAGVESALWAATRRRPAITSPGRRRFGAVSSPVSPDRRCPS